MLRRLLDSLRGPKGPTIEDFADLRADHERLAADFRQLRMEWATTLDKITSWAGRQAKRDARALERLTAEQDSPSPPMLSLDDKDNLRRLARQRGSAK